MATVCYHDDHLVVNVHKGSNPFMYKLSLHVHGNLAEKNFFDASTNNQTNTHISTVHYFCAYFFVYDIFSYIFINLYDIIIPFRTFYLEVDYDSTIMH